MSESIVGLLNHENHIVAVDPENPGVFVVNQADQILNVNNGEKIPALQTPLERSMLRHLSQAALQSLKLKSDLAFANVAHNSVKTELSEVQELNEQLLIDKDTSLLTKAGLFLKLPEFIDEAKAAHKEIVVMFVDLDGLKKLNDENGHGAGDELIKVGAKSIAQSARTEDLVARYGGDEFVVFAQVDAKQLEDIDAYEQLVRVRVANNFAKNLVESNLLLDVAEEAGTSNNTNMPYGASVGVSFFDHENKTPEEAIEAADKSMYEHKQAKYIKADVVAA